MENSATGSVTKEANGDISLTFRASPHGVAKYTAPPNIWASHFCDASQGGESHYRWYTAMTFLKSSGPIDIVQVPIEQEGLHGHGSGESPRMRIAPALKTGDLVADVSDPKFVRVGRVTCPPSGSHIRMRMLGYVKMDMGGFNLYGGPGDNFDDSDVLPENLMLISRVGA